MQQHFMHWLQESALEHAEQLFQDGDVDRDGKLTCEEILALMLKVGPGTLVAVAACFFEVRLCRSALDLPKPVVARM